MKSEIAERVKKVIKADPIGSATRLWGPPQRMEGGRCYWLSPLRAGDRNPGFEIKGNGECFEGGRHVGDIIRVYAEASAGSYDDSDFVPTCEKLAPILGVVSPTETPSNFPLAKVPTLSKLDNWAAYYGLKWSNFKDAGCSTIKSRFKDHGQHWSVLYPTEGDQGEGGKIRSLDRVVMREDGKTKRAVIHKHGGAGFFPASDMKGKGPLIITAGEEKAIALRVAGFRAVSYSCGEGAVSKRLCKFLIEQDNKEFIVAYDGDIAGREGADATAERLYSEGAKSVHVIAFPDGMDVNDVMKAEGVDGLKGYVASAPLWKPGTVSKQASEYARQTFQLIESTETCQTQWPAREWVIEGLIPRGLTIIFGEPKVGKTLLATKMTGCLVMGRDFLGYPVQKKAALYIDGESDRQGFAERMKLVGFDMGLSGLYEFCPEDEWQFDRQGMSEVEGVLKEHPEIKVIVIDTLENLIPYPAKMDNGLNAQQRDVQRLKPIRKWCARMGVSVIVIHHPKKGKIEGDFFSAMAGSNGVRGTVETIIGIAADGDSEELFRLKSSSRYMPGLDLQLMRRKGSVQWEIANAAAIEAACVSPLQADILAYLKANPHSRPSTIAKALRKERGTVGTVCTRLRKKGVLGCTDKGLYFVLRGGDVVDSHGFIDETGDEGGYDAPDF